MGDRKWRRSDRRDARRRNTAAFDKAVVCSPDDHSAGRRWRGAEDWRRYWSALAAPGLSRAESLKLAAHEPLRK